MSGARRGSVPEQIDKFAGVQASRLLGKLAFQVRHAASRNSASSSILLLPSRAVSVGRTSAFMAFNRSCPTYTRTHDAGHPGTAAAEVAEGEALAVARHQRGGVAGSLGLQCDLLLARRRLRQLVEHRVLLRLRRLGGSHI